MIAILKEFGRGQVTLPKKWRDKFNTKVYMAKETTQGLLIVPFTDDAVKIDEHKLKDEIKHKHTTSFFRRKQIGKEK